MLPAVLAFAAIQLAAACGCYALARHGGVGGVVLATAGGLLGFVVGAALFMSRLLVLQFVVLTVVGLASLAWRGRSKTFALSGMVASLVVIAVAGTWAAHKWSALRADYPIESLADRLAYESRPTKPADTQIAGDLDAPGDATLRQAAPLPEDRLAELDQSYYQSRGPFSYYRAQVRTESLRLVHATHVEQFISSEGFGLSRMPRPSPSAINYVRPQEPVPIPVDVAPESSAEREQERNLPPHEPLADALRSDVQSMHTHSLADFANPAGFGYIESRQRVAGFLPHAFSKPPELREQPQWTVSKVELVSLLKHERPMVYVSANLPNMSELKETPVRQLDAFEQRGLTALMAGDDLEIEPAAERIRMVGAIRAAKQCLECHTVARGALLGAFSYELRSCVPEAPAVPQAPAESPF